MKTPYNDYRLRITAIVQELGAALQHLDQAEESDQHRSAEIEDLKDAAAALKNASEMASAAAHQITGQ
jgi:hypothetical protein